MASRYGLHDETGSGARSFIPPYRDGEHVTFSKGYHAGRIDYHAYVIYPNTVSLGSSIEARRARWDSKHLTTADAAFSGLVHPSNPTRLNANLSEALGHEIFAWFRSEFTKPEHSQILYEPNRVMVYDPATRIVRVYREGSDQGSAPEHTFSQPCIFPAEKLGLAPAQAWGGPY
jgi:hypothetical protein